MFYLIRAHGKIDDIPFEIPKGYGFITLAEAGTSRQSNENNFLLEKLSKILKKISYYNNKILNSASEYEKKECTNKKRTFTFLLKSMLLPFSNENIKIFLTSIENELDKDNGDIQTLKIEGVSKYVNDMNNFIDFVESCFKDISKIKNCDSNKEKKEVITRWKTNIEHIKYFSEKSIMSNSNLNFHGTYSYENDDDNSKNTVGITRSGVIALSDLSNEKNNIIKYNVPRFSVKNKDGPDYSLGFDYYYIDSFGRIKNFDIINLNEDYTCDELLKKCKYIKSNKDAVRTFNDKYNDKYKDKEPLNEKSIKMLICKNVLFFYNFKRSIFKTNTGVNNKINDALSNSINNIYTKYTEYYNRKFEGKIITPRMLRHAAKELYRLEIKYAFENYKCLSRMNISDLVSGDNPILPKGVYIITSCRKGHSTIEKYSDDDTIFLNTWESLIEL